MKNTAYIDVRVKPNQPGFKITCKGPRLDIELRSKPDKNEANLELIKMFTRILKKPVYLTSGKKSKNKILRIEDTTREEVLNTLKEIKN